MAGDASHLTERQAHLIKVGDVHVERAVEHHLDGDPFATDTCLELAAEAYDWAGAIEQELTA